MEARPGQPGHGIRSVGGDLVTSGEEVGAPLHTPREHSATHRGGALKQGLSSHPQE